VTHLNTAAWERLCELATRGPEPGQFAEAEAFIAEAEALTNAARALINPCAVSPAKARILRYPITPRATCSPGREMR
jgi:hypothetical protein